MTTIATAEDLTLASDHEVRVALETLARFRNNTRSPLVQHRLDAAMAEVAEEGERRQQINTRSNEP